MKSNPYSAYSDDGVIKRAVGGQDSGDLTIAEMMRRLMVKLAAQAEKTDSLNDRIWWLNVALLALTVVTVVLAGAQVYFAWKGVR